MADEVWWDGERNREKTNTTIHFMFRLFFIYQFLCPKSNRKLHFSRYRVELWSCIARTICSEFYNHQLPVVSLWGWRGEVKTKTCAISATTSNCLTFLSRFIFCNTIYLFFIYWCSDSSRHHITKFIYLLPLLIQKWISSRPIDPSIFPIQVFSFVIFGHITC